MGFPLCGKPILYGAYSVMVSTRVCGTLSQGSNPCRHPTLNFLIY